MSELEVTVSRGEVDELEEDRMEFPRGGMHCHVSACQGRDTWFPRFWGYLDHWLQVHRQQVRRHKCTTCGTLFRKRSSCRLHLRKTHKQGEAAEVWVPNPCFINPGRALLPRPTPPADQPQDPSPGTLSPGRLALRHQEEERRHSLPSRRRSWEEREEEELEQMEAMPSPRPLNAACTCEKNYVKADVSDDAKMCTQSLAFIGCLKGIDGTLCDGSATVVAGAGAADTVQGALSSPACSPSDGCNCEITYAKADISDDTKKCTQAGTFISCLKTKTGTGCDGSTTVAAMAGTADTAMTSSITGCTQSDGCVCEAAYAKADISDDAKKCTQAGTFISCLKTKTGTGCDETTTVAAMAGTADTAMGTITGCTQSAGCLCESTYAQADISSSAKKCTEAKKFIGCLKTEVGTGCDGSTTVASLATSTNTYIGTLSGCTKSDACMCEVAYASADISDDTKKCTEVKKYISCLKSKTGMGCDGTSTVVQLATAAGTTASGITGCTLTATTCQCELDYAKADISDDTKLCTETKNYVDCLKGKATTGCVDSKSTLVTAAETTMSAITGGACDITSTVCACDAAYAKLDTSTDALKCTAEKNYISCLLGKSGTGCDGSTTLIASATAAESAISTIGATCTKTSVCDCEIAYAKADISTNALKCAATKDLTTCTMLSIDNGCGASTTKTNVGSVASTAFTALSTNCATTTTCDCQATFNAADVTSTAKCTSANALITCLDAITSTTETACDGTQLTTELKTNVTTSVQAALCSFGARAEASSFVAVLMMTMSVLVISL